MIKFLGLENVVKPTKIFKNNSIQGFRYSNFASKPDTFEYSNSVTSPISFTGKSNRLKEYKNLTESLNKTADKAQTSLTNQLESENWAGKTADTISVLWASKNRASLVQSDIDAFKQNINDLNDSIKMDKFEETYKNIFDVEYNHSDITRYSKKAKQYETAVVVDCINKFAEEKLSKNLKIYNKNSGKLQDINELKTNLYASSGCIPSYNQTTPKEEIFENMENSLVDILGGKDVLNNLLSVNGLDLDKATNDDKYKMYGHLSKFILESSKAMSDKCLKGQTVDQIKEDYDKCYKKAFGTKNDIIARVDKYNTSQKIGSACVEFVSNVILNTLGPASVLGSCAYSMGKSVMFDIADAKTRKVNRDIDYKNLVVNAGLSGVSGTINRVIVNKYAGSVASKILSGKSHSDNLIPMLRDFVVKEIISKEGVKLPAYGIEEVVKYVVKTMAGLNLSENFEGLTKNDLKNSLAVVTESIAYLNSSTNDKNLNKNISKKELVSLLNNHITSFNKNDLEFTSWVNKNKTVVNQLLIQLVNNENIDKAI